VLSDMLHEKIRTEIRAICCVYSLAHLLTHFLSCPHPTNHTRVPPVPPAESPQWRRGPPAKPILCNACGTRYRRTHHLGPPIPSAGRIGGAKSGAAARGGSSTTSSGSSTPGRKRPALDVPPPLPVNFEGGVHTGTRQARNPRGPNKQQKRG